MMKKIIKSLLFTLLVFSVNAQDLTGEWVGTIQKNTNSYPYIYSMSIKQADREVKGNSQINYKEEEWFCTKKMDGVVIGGSLLYAETVFIEHHHERGAYWMLIQGKLNYDKENDKLYGWVNAFDPHTYSLYKKHDYVELWRKKTKYAIVVDTKNTCE